MRSGCDIGAGAGRRRGFTLVELAVVLAVVGIMGGMAAYSASRSRDRVQVERSAADLRAAVERARALARVAGPRLGTGRINFGPNCTNPGGDLLWIDLAPGPGDVFIPHAVNYDPVDDELDVACRRWDWGGESGAEDEASFASPAGRIVFGFTANGRLAFAPGFPRQDVLVQLRHDPSGTLFPGFRVLPAGLTCLASHPDPLVEACDLDL